MSQDKNISKKYKLDRIERIQKYIQSTSSIINHCLQDTYITDEMFDESILEIARKQCQITDLLDDIIVEDILNEN